MLTIKRKNMKKNNIARLAFILATMMLFASCGKTYMEENQDAYKATDVIPIVLGVSGPSQVLQTFAYDFKVTYDRAGSTWSWSATDATVSSVSTDMKTATILFDQLPASGKAYVNVTETTKGGKISPEKSVEVAVNEFCPLVNGIADLVGSWSGTDEGYVSIITSAVNGTNLDLSGIGTPFIEDWWAEEVVAGGTCSVTINPDGTLVIPRQHIFTTLYDGDNYDYDIAGSGNWDNCGASPTMVIKYDIYYEGESEGLAEHYGPLGYLPNPYLTADIVLD
jgi:hypothetical protein